MHESCELLVKKKESKKGWSADQADLEILVLATFQNLLGFVSIISTAALLAK
jgi:hypothetical protein